MANIVNRFSEILGERRLKISDIQRITGISRTTLTNLYYDKSQSITFDILGKLCDALECDVSDLFTSDRHQQKVSANVEYDLNTLVTPFSKHEIKRLRESMNLTQSELAKRLNVSQQQISQWESGKRIPKESSIRRIYCALVPPGLLTEQRIKIAQLMFNPDFGSIGDNIRTLRKQNNYTQQELADAIGVNVQTIRSYESGAYEPKYDIRMKLTWFFFHQFTMRSENRNDKNTKLD